MSYNILGINPFHNGSACVLSDGEIVYFLEEERLSKRKYDSNPFRVILDILNSFKINKVIVGGINDDRRYLCYTNECPFEALIHKYYPEIPVHNFSNFHHSLHTTQAFYNSGFLESLGIVIDGGGSFFEGKGREKDSLYTHSLKKGHKTLFKNYLPNPTMNAKTELGIASAYSAVNEYLGFKTNEEGKTMGLSSYGKFNDLFPNLFTKNFLSNTNFLYECLEIENDEFTDQKSLIYKYKLTLPTFPSSQLFLDRSKNPSKITQKEKDLAWKIQNDTQQIVGDLIEKGLKETGLKQVCCSGGYFLNCVANYYLIKRFPDIEFYFEPISHDAGTAIGAALMEYHQSTKDTTIRPFKSLYLGKHYSKDELLEGIKKYI